MAMTSEIKVERGPRTYPWLAGAGFVLLPALFIFVLAYKFDIPLLFLASLGFVASVAMMVRPTLATVFVTFVLYSNLAVIAKQLHNVPTAIAGAFVALLFIPLFRYLVVDSEAVVVNRVFLVMLGYFVVLFGTAVASRDPMLSRDRLISYCSEGILLYLIFLNVVRSTKVLRQTLTTIVVAGVIVGALSIYQGVTKNYRHTFWGLAQVQRVDEATGARIPPRVAGQVGETNRYSQVMLVLLPFAAIPSFISKSRRARLASILAFTVITGAIVLTFSRSAGVTLIFFAVLMRLFGYVKWKHLALLFVGSVVIIAVLSPQFMLRMSTLVSATQNFSRADGALRGRATENIGVLRIWLAHPVLGVGTGQAPLYMEQYANGEGFRRLYEPRRGHNMYLEELADTGVVGFSVLMSIVGLTLLQLYRTRKYWLQVRPDYVHLSTSLLMSVWVYMFSALFLHLSYMRYFYLLLALAGAGCSIMRPSETPALSEPHFTSYPKNGLPQMSRSEMRSRL